MTAPRRGAGPTVRERAEADTPTDHELARGWRELRCGCRVPLDERYDAWPCAQHVAGPMIPESSHDAAAVVVSWLGSSGQADAVDDIAAALDVEPTMLLAGAVALDVPDAMAWSLAVLDMVRAADSVTAARLGAVDVRPPWAPADSALLGNIAAAAAGIAEPEAS